MNTRVITWWGGGIVYLSSRRCASLQKWGLFLVSFCMWSWRILVWFLFSFLKMLWGIYDAKRSNLFLFFFLGPFSYPLYILKNFFQIVMKSGSISFFFSLNHICDHWFPFQRHLFWSFLYFPVVPQSISLDYLVSISFVFVSRATFFSSLSESLVPLLDYFVPILAPIDKTELLPVKFDGKNNLWEFVWGPDGAISNGYKWIFIPLSNWSLMGLSTGIKHTLVLLETIRSMN